MYPVRDVLICSREVQTKTKGGLWKPENQQTAEDRAVVVAVGPGVYHPDSGKFLPVCATPAIDLNGAPVVDEDGEPYVVNGVKPGDTVIFHKGNAFEFTEGGRSFIALRPEVLAAVIPAEKE